MTRRAQLGSGWSFAVVTRRLRLRNRASPAAAAAIAGALAATIAAPATAIADGDPSEPCHLLCVNDAGRTEAPARGERPPGGRFLVRVSTAYLEPIGIYAERRYLARPPGSRAFAVQVVPSVTWLPRRDLAVTAGGSVEHNRSRGVVLPTLLPRDEPHAETAPGRPFISIRTLLAPSAGAEPWIGLGYALSDPIGTVAVEESLRTTPQTGVEALGVGTDDLYVTGELFARPRPGWEASTRGELRLHALPRGERLYATTVAYGAWLGRELDPAWTVGLLAGGYRTIFHTLPIQQATVLAVTPTVSRRIGRSRISIGVGGTLPGAALNRNALRIVTMQAAVDAAF